MPGAYLYGWCVETGKHVKLRVDADGSIHMVGYVDSLDDIGDVNVPTPTDGYVLYWDATAGKWQPTARLALIQALTADHTWSGLTAPMTAGAALTRGQAVYVGGDSKMELADKDLAATMPAIALVTPATIAENAAGEFLLQGYFRDDTWNWTPGGILYVGDDGALVQDVSGYTTGDQVQVVGVAITADIIYFNPSYELVEIS